MNPETRVYVIVESILLVFVIAAILSGCTVAHDAFTNPTGKVTLDRQRVLDTYARARQLYVEIRTRAAVACRDGQLSEATCAEFAVVDREARALDFEFRAKLAVPEASIDWEMVEKVLGFAVKLVL